MNAKLAGLASLALLTVACGPAYTVVHQATPNPFTQPGCKLAVAPLTFEGLQVGEKSEAQYLSEKDDGQRSSFEEDKKATSEAFMSRVASKNPALFVQAAGAPNTFVLRSNLAFWEPGFYAVMASKAAEGIFKIQITDPGGNVLDEIRVTASVPSTLTTPSTGQRMRLVGEDAADRTTKYLRERFVCAKE
jgi:hypothetical protein